MKDVKEAKVSPGKPGRREKAGHRESAGAGKSAGVATDYDLGVIYGGFDHIYYRMAEIANSAEVIGLGVKQLMPKLREEIPDDFLGHLELALEKIYDYARIAKSVAYDIQMIVDNKRMGAK